jgi:hypothetical protein
MKVAVLTLTRYPSRHIVTALHSMLLFRIPMTKNKKISFFKMLGCGRSGSFDLNPDWNQYGIFTVSDSTDLSPFSHERYDSWKKEYYGSFISKWWTFCGCETWTIILEPVLSHGSWSGVELFPETVNKTYKGPVGVLTRATIRASKATEFWKNVKPLQEKMKDVQGLVFSVGIGEMPLLKQATFSLWENEEHMKSFAYSMKQHRAVISKTRSLDWYSEEMFTRFRPMAFAGQLKGRNPLPADFIPSLSHL